MIASLLFAAAVATTTPAQAVADDNKLVCKYEANLGTRLPVKTCKTKGQIARDAQEAKERTTTAQSPGGVKGQ